MHLIQIESEEAVVWLEKLIKNSLNGDPNSPALIAAYKHLVVWQEALQNKMVDKDIVKLPEVQEIIKEQVAKKQIRKPRTTKAKKRTPKKKEVDPFTCNQHPTYTGARIPRSGCEGCWEIYKKFHPMEYAQKRAAYERNSKKK